MGKNKESFRPLLGDFISNRLGSEIKADFEEVFVPYWGALFLIGNKSFIKN